VSGALILHKTAAFLHEGWKMLSYKKRHRRKKYLAKAGLYKALPVKAKKQLKTV